MKICLLSCLLCIYTNYHNAYKAREKSFILRNKSRNVKIYWQKPSIFLKKKCFARTSRNCRICQSVLPVFFISLHMYFPFLFLYVSTEWKHDVSVLVHMKTWYFKKCMKGHVPCMNKHSFLSSAVEMFTYQT